MWSTVVAVATATIVGGAKGVSSAECKCYLDLKLGRHKVLSVVKLFLFRWNRGQRSSWMMRRPVQTPSC